MFCFWLILTSSEKLESLIEKHRKRAKKGLKVKHPKTYIVKPDRGVGGNGIKLTQDLSQFVDKQGSNTGNLSECVIQEYIEKVIVVV